MIGTWWLGGSLRVRRRPPVLAPRFGTPQVPQVRVWGGVFRIVFPPKGVERLDLGQGGVGAAKIGDRLSSGPDCVAAKHRPKHLRDRMRAIIHDHGTCLKNVHERVAASSRQRDRPLRQTHRGATCRTQAGRDVCKGQVHGARGPQDRRAQWGGMVEDGDWTWKN